MESNLQKLPNARQAAVVPVRDGERTVTLKKQAATLLPAYMIPRKIMTMESFPLNVNGKIDRKALAARLEGTP